MGKDLISDIRGAISRIVRSFKTVVDKARQIYLVGELYIHLEIDQRGQVLALANRKGLADISRPIWKVKSAAGEISGLNGWLVSKGYAGLARVTMEVPSLFRRVYLGRDEKTGEHLFEGTLQPGELERSLEARFKGILEPRGLELFSGSPATGQFVQAEAKSVGFRRDGQDRLTNLPMVHFGEAKWSKAAELLGFQPREATANGLQKAAFRATSCVSAGSEKAADGHGNLNLQSFNVVVGGIGNDPIEELVRGKMFPDVEVPWEKFGANAKYFSHKGIPLVKVHISCIETEGVYLGKDKADMDGQAYLSMKWLPVLKQASAARLDDYEDPGAISVLVRFCLEGLSIWRATTKKGWRMKVRKPKSALFKGWSSGEHIFGKGDIVIIPDDDFVKLAEEKGLDIHEDQPTLLVDSNWAKYRDPRKSESLQWLFLHDAINARVEKKEFSFYATERLFPGGRARTLFHVQILKQHQKLLKKIKDEGWRCVYDGSDTESLDKIKAYLENGYMAVKDVGSVQKVLLKGYLSKVLNVRALGTSLKAVSDWKGHRGREDEVFLHPQFRKDLGDWGLMVRFPAISTANGQWVRYRYDSAVPVNAAIVSSSHCKDLQLDFDGDAPVFYSGKDEFIQALARIRPENSHLEKDLKDGLEVPTTGGGARSKAIVRAFVAQVLTGYADNCLTMAYGQGEASSIERAQQFLQATVSAIKKPTADFPIVGYSALDLVYQLLRKKFDKWEKVVQGDIPINNLLVARDNHLGAFVVEIAKDIRDLFDADRKDVELTEAQIEWFEARLAMGDLGPLFKALGRAESALKGVYSTYMSLISAETTEWNQFNKLALQEEQSESGKAAFASAFECESWEEFIETKWSNEGFRKQLVLGLGVGQESLTQTLHFVRGNLPGFYQLAKFGWRFQADIRAEERAKRSKQGEERDGNPKTPESPKGDEG